MHNNDYLLDASTKISKVNDNNVTRHKREETGIFVIKYLLHVKLYHIVWKVYSHDLPNIFIYFFKD